MDALLALRSVSKHYGTATNTVVALDGVDLDIARGEMVAIMGASGSGKSTLLTIAGGLERPSSGQVGLDGTELWDLDAAALARVRRRELGFVFQEFNLLSGLTAVENVAAPLELDGVSAKRAATQALARLDEVGLADLAGRLPDDLSGGERQRVAIARALVGDRRLVLADEPTGALDSTTGRAIMDLLRAAATSERAVLLVTHDAALAGWADRIVRLRDGRLDDEAVAAAGARDREVGR